ncbi:hypothetical protein JW848_05210 [Candidatus Bipolaricaulota bacterium]|nr:hypothetical protein [Candidatus Bipolaricaulota bacterium]
MNERGLAIAGRRVIVGVGLLAAAAMCVGAAALPSSYEVWVQHDPFAGARADFGADTQGLSVEQTAPWIDGGVLVDGGATVLDLIGHRTVLLVASDAFQSQYDLLFAVWAELAAGQAQVIAVLATCASSGKCLCRCAGLGQQVWAIGGEDAQWLAEAYRVSFPGSPATYLIDESGRIVYRLRRFHVRNLDEFDRVVRSFLTTGEVPADAVRERVFAEGEQIIWPEMPVQTVVGAPVELGDDGAVLLYYAGPLDGDRTATLAFELLDPLREEFPDVEFAWVEPCCGAEGCAALWRGLDLLGWTGEQTQADYVVQKLRQEAPQVSSLLAFAEEAGRAWTVTLDIQYRLQRSLTIYASGGVMIIGGDGTVSLPYAPLNIMSFDDGEPMIHPGTADLLREALEEARAASPG